MDWAFRGDHVMGFKPQDLLNSTAPDANYPFGSLRDESNPGVSDDGTPIEEQIANDVQGGLQINYVKENITPSGNPDTVLASDTRDGQSRLSARGGDLTDVAGGGTCVLGKINRPLNAGGPITVNLPTVDLYSGAVVAFDENPPVLYSLNSVTFDAGSVIIGSGGSPVQTVELTTDGLLGGFRRNRANTRWIPYKNLAVGLEI